MRSFQTARLSIRLLHTCDLDLYRSCYTDSTLMQHVGTPLAEHTVLTSFSAALKFNSNDTFQRFTWVVQEKKTLRDIGLLALILDAEKFKAAEAEIGVIILAEFHNIGYAAEVIDSLVNATFSNTTITLLCTQHSVHNAAANGLMKKLGFHHSEADSYRKWLLHRIDWQKLQNQPV